MQHCYNLHRYHRWLQNKKIYDYFSYVDAVLWDVTSTGFIESLSFGLPTVPLNIKNYLQPHYKEITYLDYRIQDSSSNFCGAYCVSFVLRVQDNLSYDQFIGHYHSDNLLENDEILKQDFSNISFLVKV